MDRMVYYSEGHEPEIVRNALSGLDVQVVYSPHRLLESLLDQPALVGAVVNTGNLEEWTPLLRSITKCFPFLPILLIVPANSTGCPTEFPCIVDDASDAALRAAVEAMIAKATGRERRHHHRFSWPLTATVVGGDGTVHRVSEISAGGAYLEPASAVFGRGQACELEISFQNFTMTAACIILDPRHTSSRKAGGFGVRFDNLSEVATAFIDRIVQDALIGILIDSSASPEVPSLDEDDLLSVGDEFALI